ncbi:MAG: replication restart helicase PriA [Planctomycetota bacterium]|jgi:primosomal protein N' (replication factor Y)
MATLFDPETAVGFARVAVERGVDQYPEGLTYAIPRPLGDLAVGQRVIVPLGRADAPTAGYVVELCDAPGLEPEKIKPITGRDPGPALPGELLVLAKWISSYYCAPIGMTLSAMMPAAVKRRVGAVSRTMIDLSGGTGLEIKLPPKQQQVLEVLAGLEPGQRPVELRRLAGLAGLRTTSPILRLVERNLVAGTARSAVEAAWIEQAVDRTVPRTLTPAQQAAIEAVGRELESGFSVHLLFGVTGSGKTEVYIRLIERVLGAGGTVLVLVPEIALTPQTGGRLIGRLPDHRVAVHHSGLTAAQRHQQWALAADGTARVVLGARSAVFAPVPDGRLGLIIVDEEHDGSYKQDQVPRYHGRDVAVRRGQIANCPVVLGSATPSLESWHNATVRGTYHLHRLAERVPGLQVPAVKLVDLVEERRRFRAPGRAHLLGPILEAAVGRTLDAGGQVLLLLNRRGFANYIACPDHRCGWMLCCDHCDAAMVYHLDRKLSGGGYTRCHHCDAQQRLPETCPTCSRRVGTFGLGTQRVERELQRTFPQLVEGETMLRVDSDTMRGARDFHRVLERFGAGEIRLMLGTQMIAKGLDFPGVQLVGVVNADTAINLPDFRATERTFQLVSQVAGRCGRGRGPGKVIVQTFQPDAPPIRLAADGEYETFADLELADRRRCGLPPFTRMGRIIVRDADHGRCLVAARRLAERLGAMSGGAIQVRGPAPCPIGRIAGRHRQQIELLAETARDLQGLLSAARSEGVIKPGHAVAVDVDPIALL